MNNIFIIEGGIGKSVMATAVCAAIKKKYPKDKLVVVTAYTDVFTNNPNVDRIVNFGATSYFYTDFIEGGKLKNLFVHNPYVQTEFILEESHLIKIWCEMYNLPYNGEMPELFLSKREKEFYLRDFNVNKPIMFVQTNGGADNQATLYSWARDIPFDTAQEVVNAFKDEYTIFHIRRQNQLGLFNTTPLTASFREIAAVLEKGQKFLFMDSFAQHTAAAYKIKSTVCWIANNPTLFGYEWNDNIVSNPFTAVPDLRNSYLSKYNIVGDPLEFPYNDEKEIFNVEQLIESIKKQ